MHMIHMLGIVAIVFFVSMLLMCWYRDKLQQRMIDILFICANTVFIFLWNCAGYELGWLKSSLMILDNISPYIATVITLTVILRTKIREYAHSAMAFLSFGMFLALFLSPFHEFAFKFVREARFIHITEASCHLIMALYGFYLILSKRVKITLVNLGKACAFMFSTVAFGVFLNWCFGYNYFGMSVKGNYSIYFLKIFDSFGATLLAYLFGILAVLCMGFLVGAWLDKFAENKKEVEKDVACDTDSVPELAK